MGWHLFLLLNRVHSSPLQAAAFHGACGEPLRQACRVSPCPLFPLESAAFRSEELCDYGI